MQHAYNISRQTILSDLVLCDMKKHPQWCCAQEHTNKMIYKFFKHTEADILQMTYFFQSFYSIIVFDSTFIENSF